MSLPYTEKLIEYFMHPKNVSEIDDADAVATDELGGLPPAKVHCAVLAVDALKTAIENYKKQTETCNKFNNRS